jgi:uncharacterized membrane-anchored protein YjiN (DUF445 family)
MTNNKAREVNNPIIEELLDETTAEELAKIDATMTNNKQQTAVKLYTEEQVLNTAEAIRDYLKNYPEKFHESMIEKHLKNLTPIELPSDEEIEEESPYVPNDASVDFWSHKEGFVDGAIWMRNKIQGGEQ